MLWENQMNKPEKADLAYLIWLVQQDHTNVKVLPNRRYAAVRQFMYTYAIIVGQIGDKTAYDDRWCYHNANDAATALARWDGTGEPTGWHRHPATGRRVNEAGEEYINP